MKLRQSYTRQAYLGAPSQPSIWVNYSLLIIMLILIVVDGILTKNLIQRGIGTEANPFLINIVQTDDFLLWKLLGGLLVCTLLHWGYLRIKDKKIMIKTTLTFIIMYVMIVAWNIGCLRI